MMDGQQEVPFRTSRQKWFTAEQKWALLLEYDQCLDRGSKSAFCRRVGIWKGTPLEWLRQRADGRLVDPATVENMTKPRGRPSWDERQELERLRRENESLQRRLEQSEAAADVLGKAAALLEALSKSAENEQPRQSPPLPGRPGWLSDPDTSRLPSIPPKNS